MKTIKQILQKQIADPILKHDDIASLGWRRINAWENGTSVYDFTCKKKPYNIVFVLRNHPTHVDLTTIVFDGKGEKHEEIINAKNKQELSSIMTNRHIENNINPDFL